MSYKINLIIVIIISIFIISCENSANKVSCETIDDCKTGEVCKDKICGLPVIIEKDCVNTDNCIDGYYCNQDNKCIKDICDSDNYCGRGEICIDEKCIEGCRVDENCGIGKTCKDLKCKEKEDCRDNLVCKQGYNCNISNGECNINEDCLTNIDCPNNYECKRSKCLLKTSCTDNSICENNEICKENGFCGIDTGCETDQYCINKNSLKPICNKISGLCYECNLNSDCSDNRVCKEHICKDKELECDSNSDCGNNEKCDKTISPFECIEVECFIDTDCSNNMKCLTNTNVCVECLIDNNCEIGKVCNLNTNYCELPENENCVTDQDCNVILGETCLNGDCIDPISVEASFYQWGTSRNDRASSVAVDSNNNIYITGRVGASLDGETYNREYDIFLTKFNNSGVKEWTKQWGSSRNDEGKSVAIDSNNNIYVVGKTEGDLDNNRSSGWEDIFLTKFNNSGVKEWTKQWGTFNDDEGFSIAIDNNDNIYVTGFTKGSLEESVNARGKDIFLTKFNSSGVKEWTKQWGSVFDDEGFSVAIDNNNNLYITGYTSHDLDGNNSLGWQDIFLTKFNNSGVKEWTKQWGTNSEEGGFSVAIDSNNDIYITGITNSALDGNASLGNNDIFLIKANHLGEKLWTKQWGTNHEDYGYSLAIKNNSIYITGYTDGILNENENRGKNDIFLTKFETNGNKSWSREWGTTQSDGGFSIAIDHNNDILITGSTYGDLEGSNFGYEDLFLLKLEQ